MRLLSVYSTVHLWVRLIPLVCTTLPPKVVTEHSLTLDGCWYSHLSLHLIVGVSSELRWYRDLLSSWGRNSLLGSVLLGRYYGILRTGYLCYSNFFHITKFDDIKPPFHNTPLSIDYRWEQRRSPRTYNSPFILTSDFLDLLPSLPTQSISSSSFLSKKTVTIVKVCTEDEIN